MFEFQQYLGFLLFLGIFLTGFWLDAILGKLRVLLGWWSTLGKIQREKSRKSTRVSAKSFFFEIKKSRQFGTFFMFFCFQKGYGLFLAPGGVASFFIFSRFCNGKR